MERINVEKLIKESVRIEEKLRDIEERCKVTYSSKIHILRVQDVKEQG